MTYGIIGVNFLTRKNKGEGNTKKCLTLIKTLEKSVKM